MIPLLTKPPEREGGSSGDSSQNRQGLFSVNIHPFWLPVYRLAVRKVERMNVLLYKMTMYQVALLNEAYEMDLAVKGDLQWPTIEDYDNYVDPLTGKHTPIKLPFV